MFDFLTLDYIKSLGIKGSVVRGNEIWMNCPFHMEEKPSSKINLETGRFKCFGCGKSLGIMDFLLQNGKKMSDFNMAFFRELARSEKNNIYEKKKIKDDPLLKFRNKEKDEKSYIKDSFLDQFTQKKFPKKFVEMMGYDHILKYEVMYDEKNNTLVFPVRDIDGYLVSVAGREYYSGKFFFYKVIYKGLLGVNRAVYSDSIMIVEGLRDWLLLSKFFNFPVVCLMGSELSSKGISDIKYLRREKLYEIILGLDNDKTGERAFDHISKIIIKEDLCDRLYKMTPILKDWMDMYKEGIDLNVKKKTYLEYKLERKSYLCGN